MCDLFSVPPIHTPATTFKDLPADVKQRLYLVHVAAKDVPQDLGLKAAQEGVEHTLLLPAVPPPYLEAVTILELMSDIDLFRSFPARRVPELLTICRRQWFAPGHVIVDEGQPDGGSAFYVIWSGFVESAKSDGRMEYLRFGVLCFLGGFINFHKCCLIFAPLFSLHTISTGQYFGYSALLSNEPSTSRQVALTECVCICFPRYELLRLLAGTEVCSTFSNVYPT